MYKLCEINGLVIAIRNTSISREKELLPQRKEKEEEVELGALKFMSRKVHLAK